MRGRWCNCICSFFTQSSLRSGHFALLRQLFMKVFTEEVSKCIVWLPLSLHLVLSLSPSPPLPHLVIPFSTSPPTFCQPLLHLSSHILPPLFIPLLPRMGERLFVHMQWVWLPPSISVPTWLAVSLSTACTNSSRIAASRNMAALSR